MDNSCIVLGNGPSLANVDKAILNMLPTFGTNRIYLYYTPTYYACVNRLIAEQSIKEITELASEKFITESVEIQGATKLHSGFDGDFSLDPTMYINEGSTVTYVCLQLAYWKGFRTVYLLGVDHKYVYTGDPNQEIICDGKDINHFSENYMLPGEKWNCPDLVASEIYYNIAKRVFDADGRSIINLTEGSELDIFQKMDMNDIFRKGEST